MSHTIYDGHDELYHHAKFGEDRTMRAGCRCENVVFVFTGRIAAKRQTAGIIRLDALAWSVIATATWLGGWLGVCHSRYCIKTTKPI